MKKISIIGRKPKPYGGLSIFVQRLEDKLNKDNNQVVSIDPREKLSLIIFSISLFSPFKKWDRIIMNNFSTLFLIILFITKKTKKITLVDHNHSRHFKKKSAFSLIIFKYIIPKIDLLWLVSDHLKDNYKEYNIKLPRNIITSSPYIPVSKDVMTLDKSNVPDKINSILRSYENVFVNSSSQSISSLSDDIYGIKDSIKAFSNMREEKSALIISHSFFNDSIENEIRSYCTNLNIDEHVFYTRGDFPLWAIFDDITAFLRTTKTDGNSVSVMEALDSKTTVIASNVVPRPVGCSIYKEGDIEDLSSKMLKAIK